MDGKCITWNLGASEAEMERRTEQARRPAETRGPRTPPRVLTMVYDSLKELLLSSWIVFHVFLPLIIFASKFGHDLDARPGKRTPRGESLRPGDDRGGDRHRADDGHAGDCCVPRGYLTSVATSSCLALQARMVHYSNPIPA